MNTKEEALFLSKGFDGRNEKELGMVKAHEVKETWNLQAVEKYNTKGTNVNGKWFPFHIRILEENCIRNNREYKILN